MKIQIDDNFYIESDAYCFVLVSGNIHLYYPKISDCLKRYLNESLKKCDSIESVLKKISEVELKIDRFMSGLGTSGVTKDIFYRELNKVSDDE